MRITNGIMMNNNLFNINKNKQEMDRIMTQIDTTKKIQRPSDDPIIAIRALRLRATYNEIQQYKDRNVEDADSWMKETADALEQETETLENIIYYCNQGVNEYQTADEYQAIIQTLKQYREALYESGNADYSGRTVFTGYKTDTTLTFEKDDDTISYEITEKVAYEDIDNMGRVVGVLPDDIENYTGTAYTGIDITNEKLHILRLSYDNVDVDKLEIDPAVATITVRSLETNGQQAYDNIAPNQIYLIPETGEMIFGEDVYNSLVDTEFSVTYKKTGFEKGDLRPEHYFDCTKTETQGTAQTVTNYTLKEQDINYNVSFNQKITVNTQGKDVFKHAMGRDIDELIERLNDVVTALSKKEKIETKLAQVTNDADKASLEDMLEAAELERAYAQENLKNGFADGIAKFKEHQQVVSVEISDLAARRKRVSMIKERLEQQSLTVEELKSENEDTNLSEAVVQYNAISDVYDAALSTAAKVVQKSLLDFL